MARDYSMKEMMKEIFNPKLVVKQFDDAGGTYDSVAIMQRYAADQLLDRLSYIKHDINSVLDVGAGTGYCAKKINERFPSAKIVALDTSQKMLSNIAEKNIEIICAPAEKMPLVDNSIDLVFCNMMLHWSLDIPTIFDEVNRVLKKGGLFLYTTLGPDTLHELRTSWSKIDDYNHVHHFYDMHDLGDAMLQAGFHDPVMDAQKMTMRYRELKKLFDDFKKLGVRNVAEPRRRGLTTKKQYLKLLSEYEKFKTENSFPATYEIVYGHAWGGVKKTPGEFRVSVDDISR